MTPCHENGRGCIRAFEDGTCGEQGQCSIMLAILAERERCARIAESATKTTYMMWDPEGKHPCVSPASDRGIIAAAIRKDPTCPA